MNFLTSTRIRKILANLADRLSMPEDSVAVTFKALPYKGTWVHRDMALCLAEYCDDTCQLETAVGQAIRALADRPPPPPPTAAASSIQGEVAAYKELLSVKAALFTTEQQHVAAMTLAEQQRARARMQAKEAEAASDRRISQAKADRARQRKEQDTQLKALQDKQDQLRRVASRGVSKPGKDSFAMHEAVAQAAVELDVAEFAVVAFMHAKHGGFANYQRVVYELHMHKVGKTVTQSHQAGYNDPALYSTKDFRAVVRWIRQHYKTTVQI